MGQVPAFVRFQYPLWALCDTQETTTLTDLPRQMNSGGRALPQKAWDMPEPNRGRPGIDQMPWKEDVIFSGSSRKERIRNRVGLISISRTAA
ncbi:hypothetical protein J6590_027916 [Homalodisca vitripennis]|nr:hypothetical protein J6590_027916 [Homalodisca vitripennis]